MNKVLFLTMLALVVGILLGENHRGRGLFFTSWYGDELYYGQHVQWKGAKDTCQYITIIGFDGAYAWLKIKDCETGTFYHAYPLSGLEKAD